MVDPVTGAVASAVANHSVAKVKEYIEESNDPEGVWEESVYEIAVKLRTSHKQNSQRLNQDKYKRQLNRFGDMLRELAVRGGIRDFEASNVELVESMADSVTEIQKGPNYASKSLSGEYESEGIDDLVDECIERFGPTS